MFAPRGAGGYQGFTALSRECFLRMFLHTYSVQSRDSPLGSGGVSKSYGVGGAQPVAANLSPEEVSASFNLGALGLSRQRIHHLDREHDLYLPRPSSLLTFRCVGCGEELTRPRSALRSYKHPDLCRSCSR